MKKLLFLGAMAAMLLGTASCSNDMEPEMTGDGNVQFTIELPGNIDSRAISDGVIATKLQIAVYKEDGTLLENVSRLGENAVTMSGKKATVNFKLVKGLKYSFAFWAQNPNEDAYTFDAASGKVTVDYAKAVANADDGDAFSNREMNLEITGPITKNITLTRPFAQLNYGDVVADYEAAVAAGIDFKQTQVTVKQVANEYDILNQTTSGTTKVDVTWPAAASAIANENLNVEDVNYKWLSMCYFLVPNDESTVNTELSLLNTAGTAFNTIKVSNVPVQKNHRTNILGNLFTDDVNFNIIIDERFDQPDNNYLLINGKKYETLNGAVLLKKEMTADEINELFQSHSGAYTLAENLDIDAPIVVPAGVTATLNLNGHKLFNTTDIWSTTDYTYELISVEGGNLTINGDGDVIAKADDCYPVSVWGGGNLVINGGNYNGNLHSIYVAKGTATINGGTFDLQQLETSGNGYRQEINCLDANFTNGTAQIIVTGGKFHGFDPENSMSEPNAPVSLLAPGYESVQDGEWYKVQPIN